MIGTPEQDAFISKAKRAVITTARRDGTPASSLIWFARVGDRLLFTTTSNRLKGRTLQRHPRVAICVIAASAPDSYVSVEGTVVLHMDNPPRLQEAMLDAWERQAEADGSLASMTPEAVLESREGLLAMWADPLRMIVEVTPVRVSGVFL